MRNIYSDFVLECLQLCIRSLTAIRDILESLPNVQFSDNELVVVSEYLATITASGDSPVM